jgi:hypothetical protein
LPGVYGRANAIDALAGMEYSFPDGYHFESDRGAVVCI